LVNLATTTSWLGLRRRGAQAASRIEIFDQHVCGPGHIAGEMHQPKIGIDWLPALAGWLARPL